MQKVLGRTGDTAPTAVGAELLVHFASVSRPLERRCCNIGQPVVVIGCGLLERVDFELHGNPR